MNSLTRAKKMLSHHIFSSPSPANRLLNIHPKTAALQKRDFSYTKTQQLTKPKTQKPSSPPSSTFCQRVRKQTEALTQTPVWPKPGEIPYQSKVANFVNLIGYVELPIRFESASDGNNFATTVISLVNGGEKKFTVPVVFEGDLAHIVSCHVKENDCVFVSGQLSVDPTRLVPSESLGKFHVVAENINFVEGLKKVRVQLFDEIPERVVDGDNDGKAPVINGNAESAPFTNVGKKKNPDQITDLWRDLVKSPLQWWDYRNHKANGLVKEKYPDFKQKVTGEALWISSAPKWILPGIGKLEFDVMDMKPKGGGDMRPKSGGDMKPKGGGLGDSWKNLVENPGNWFDNRMNKKNPKAPDFKHKESNDALWLNRCPDWALTKLPPLKG
ncbi:hypothetical protein CASFOL_027592 [Castilleja foliolosa]|uniref:Uncharacterized protein n=1 Tax=Castilleja foliolosa TaxID=1961234 RepID=A0ABD3CGT7_9LAMI